MSDADANATTVTRYSTFDRTPADIDDPDPTDLDHLTASLDYLDYLAGTWRVDARNSCT